MQTSREISAGFLRVFSIVGDKATVETWEQGQWGIVHRAWKNAVHGQRSKVSILTIGILGVQGGVPLP